jgi:hypothetical protein
VLAVDEGVPKAEKVVVVILVQLGVELYSLLDQNGTAEKMRVAYQVQDRDLHHALVEIRRPVLNNLDGDHLLRLQVLALDDLTERALPEDIENEIAVPAT